MSGELRELYDITTVRNDDAESALKRGKVSSDDAFQRLMANRDATATIASFVGQKDLNNWLLADRASYRDVSESAAATSDWGKGLTYLDEVVDSNILIWKKRFPLASRLVLHIEYENSLSDVCSVLQKLPNLRHLHISFYQNNRKKITIINEINFNKICNALKFLVNLETLAFDTYLLIERPFNIDSFLDLLQNYLPKMRTLNVFAFETFYRNGQKFFNDNNVLKSQFTQVIDSIGNRSFALQNLEMQLPEGVLSDEHFETLNSAFQKNGIKNLQSLIVSLPYSLRYVLKEEYFNYSIPLSQCFKLFTMIGNNLYYLKKLYFYNIRIYHLNENDNIVLETAQAMVNMIVPQNRSATIETLMFINCFSELESRGWFGNNRTVVITPQKFNTQFWKFVKFYSRVWPIFNSSASELRFMEDYSIFKNLKTLVFVNYFDINYILPLLKHAPKLENLAVSDSHHTKNVKEIIKKLSLPSLKNISVDDLQDRVPYQDEKHDEFYEKYNFMSRHDFEQLWGGRSLKRKSKSKKRSVKRTKRSRRRS